MVWQQILRGREKLINKRMLHDVCDDSRSYVICTWYYPYLLLSELVCYYGKLEVLLACLAYIFPRCI